MDLIAEGTSFATTTLPPLEAELALELVVADELELEDELLLLPQPATAATHSSDAAAESQLLLIRISAPHSYRNHPEVSRQDKQHGLHPGGFLIRPQREGVA